MENIVIRKITSHEVESAMRMALEVFMQFEAQAINGIRFTPMKYIINKGAAR